MNPAITRLVQAAYRAKTTIDAVENAASLEKAFRTLGKFAAMAVETPFAIQDQTQSLDPAHPVLEGLLREIHAATVRVAKAQEADRLQAAS